MHQRTEASLHPWTFLQMQKEVAKPAWKSCSIWLRQSRAVWGVWGSRSRSQVLPSSPGRGRLCRRGQGSHARQSLLAVNPTGWLSLVVPHRGQLSPPSHSPTQPWGTRERVGRIKVWKLMHRDQDSLTGKAKAVHASKTKSGIQSLLPMGWQMFSHP